MTTAPHDPEGNAQDHGTPSITRADMIETLCQLRPGATRKQQAVIDALIAFVGDHGRGAQG